VSFHWSLSTLTRKLSFVDSTLGRASVSFHWSLSTLGERGVAFVELRALGGRPVSFPGVRKLLEIMSFLGAPALWGVKQVLPRARRLLEGVSLWMSRKP
jgi:hypothetical protein